MANALLSVLLSFCVSTLAATPQETATAPELEPQICEAGGKGMIFPLVSTEHEWPSWLRAFLYAAGLIYCFMGVSLIADVFMSAVEAVTSRRRQVVLDGGRRITSFVWNDTVANLSLMALGSSAPEIFLSIIDLLRRDMYAGDLGPSTIVGSAAFNLLVIVAVCIVCLPEGEARQIDQLPVFYLTAWFSMFAYGWLVVILVIITPNVVDVWEALITLFLMPLLLWSSYRVDVGGFWHLVSWLPGMPETPEEELTAEGEEPSARSSVPASRSFEMPSEASDRPTKTGRSSSAPLEGGGFASGAASPKRAFMSRRRSYADYHMRAMSALPGNVGNSDCARKSVASRQTFAQTTPLSWSGSSAFDSSASVDVKGVHHQVQLLVDRQDMDEKARHKTLTVVRMSESLQVAIKVDYKVELLDAPFQLPPLVRSAFQGPVVLRGKEPPHYGGESGCSSSSKRAIAKVVSEGSVIINENETEAYVRVKRPRVECGKCQDFLFSIRSAEFRGGEPHKVEVGPIVSTQVGVLEGNKPGTLSFAADTMLVEGSASGTQAQVVVLRRGGCTGRVTCNFFTEPLDAVAEYDYRDSEGDMVFDDGVTEVRILLDIPGKSVSRGACSFLLVLKEASGGAGFDMNTDGGDEQAITTITIGARPEGDGSLGRTLDSIFNLASCRAGNDAWLDQIKSSVLVNGSYEAQQEAGPQDWVFHFVSLPWKLFFCLVPPTVYGKGWVCFYISLVFIAIVTAVIADLAELFGCVVGVEEVVTAITFVALGTSMPDLFASKVAAMEDPTADASIVNVTGSNSVNVFLGLGLPWTMGAFYWVTQDRFGEWEHKYPEVAAATPAGSMVFVVPARNLGFCVMVFCYVATIAIFLLLLRRRTIGCELGGPTTPKVLTGVSFVFSWFGYVGLASWRSMRWEQASDAEMVIIGGGIAGGSLLVAALPSAVMLRMENGPAEREEGEPAEDEALEKGHEAAPEAVQSNGTVQAPDGEKEVSFSSKEAEEMRVPPTTGASPGASVAQAREMTAHCEPPDDTASAFDEVVPAEGKGLSPLALIDSSLCTHDTDVVVAIKAAELAQHRARQASCEAVPRVPLANRTPFSKDYASRARLGGMEAKAELTSEIQIEPWMHKSPCGKDQVRAAKGPKLEPHML